jgi:hypothetical protein
MKILETKKILKFKEIGKFPKKKPISNKCVALGMARNATEDVFRFFP